MFNNNPADCCYFLSQLALNLRNLILGLSRICQFDLGVTQLIIDWMKKRGITYWKIEYVTSDAPVMVWNIMLSGLNCQVNFLCSLLIMKELIKSIWLLRKLWKKFISSVGLIKFAMTFIIFIILQKDWLVCNKLAAKWMGFF